MRPLTELEIKLHSIRTTEEYQKMYKLVEELDEKIEKDINPDRSRMIAEKKR